MSDEWFYKTKGAEVGPVSWTDLKWLADHGKLDRNALVREGRTGKWLLAKRIKGLIDLASLLPPAPGVTAPVPPVSPPRVHVPTMSFTPMTPEASIALPPTVQKKQTTENTPAAHVPSAQPAPPRQVEPAPTTPPLSPPSSLPTPPVKQPTSKQPASIDDLLPPPAIPRRPPKP